MKLDRETITKLTEANDETLWETVRGIALAKGFRLPEATPPHETMERLRGTLSGNGCAARSRGTARSRSERRCG